MSLKTSSPYNHFVSRFFLAGFASKNGQVGVYSKSKSVNGFIVKNCSPRDICGRYNFFIFDGMDDFLKSQNITEYVKDGIKLSADMLENEFSKLESDTKPILQKLLKFENLACLTKEEMGIFLYWLAWIYTANPETKEFLRRRDPSASNTSLCGGFIALHEKLFPFFLSRKFILGISKEPLLTSDKPIILVDSPTSPMDKNTLCNTTILFALSPQLLLIGLPNQERSLLGCSEVIQLLPMQTFDYNLRIFKGSTDIVIGQDRLAFQNFFLRRKLIVDLVLVLKATIKKSNDQKCKI